MAVRYVRNAVVPGDGDPRHGRVSTYWSHRCRCLLCREAKRQAYVPGSGRTRAWNLYDACPRCGVGSMERCVSKRNRKPLLRRHEGRPRRLTMLQGRPSNRVDLEDTDEL